MENLSSELNQRLMNTPRFRYPEDEAKNPWLSILLDAYHLTDTGVAIEIVEEAERRNSQPGCHIGCCNCCVKANVPVSPLEKRGIDWYLTEKVTGDVRNILEWLLPQAKEIPTCPFIVDSRCAIYPVRPLACRIFYVFGEPCESASGIGEERREDIWIHSRELAKRVAMIMLPYYGITEESDKEFAFEVGYLFSQMTLLRNLEWDKVAEKMTEFDKKS